jgi:nucleoside-diphosphate-sugar epimerase
LAPFEVPSERLDPRGKECKTMTKQVALVTGASGEMGCLLVPALTKQGFEVVTLDIARIPRELGGACRETVEGSVLDFPLVEELFRKHEPTHVFHLAAILSTQAEKDPDKAHRVNVEGTYGLFRICGALSDGSRQPVRFLFPSSIAVYGLPDAETKSRQGAVRETEWTVPSAMYGCNKLYCELLGTYLSGNRAGGARPPFDFRAIRFPGLISAETLPTGGTTDYAPEMIHAAAKGKPYDCFVSEETRLPFMTMPDGVDALLRLAAADPSDLTTRVYNIRGFSASAGEIRQAVMRRFPQAEIGFRPVAARQAIVDSWPGDIDDGLARRDWGLSPRHGMSEAMDEYLVPALMERYAGKSR